MCATFPAVHADRTGPASAFATIQELAWLVDMRAFIVADPGVVRSVLGAVKCIPMRADVELDIGRKTFASGLLPELIAVLRRSQPGDLVAVVGDEESVGPELETWCRFTGNPLLEATVEKGRSRWVFRCGTVAAPAEDNRPVGSRLWLY